MQMAADKKNYSETYLNQTLNKLESCINWKYQIKSQCMKSLLI